MKVNPKTMGWAAPTTNEDGTAITYELNYEVGVRSGENPTGDYDPIVTIPGQLRDGGRYEAPISDLPLDFGRHEIVLRAFAKDDPDRMSAWSPPVAFVLSAEKPSAPKGLQVT